MDGLECLIEPALTLTCECTDLIMSTTADMAKGALDALSNGSYPEREAKGKTRA